MKKLNELFDVAYGSKLDFNKVEAMPKSQGGVNFVGRSSQNHGVSGTICPLPDTKPFEAGLITVALGGSKLLCSFVQEHPFYTAQNVAVLKPKTEMTFAEKLWVCLCIRHNRFRYSAFGREANRTLRELLIPELIDFPNGLNEIAVEEMESKGAPKIRASIPAIQVAEWKPFKLSVLFDLKKGKRLTKAQMLEGATPFIGAIDGNNGVSGHVGQMPIHEGNTITVNYDGSVGAAFYQPAPFWASDSVNVLYPKFDLTANIALFLTTIIQREKYRFNYGRKWHLDRMSQSEIRLPVTAEGKPDWEFMENYVKTLPFSSQL